MFETSDGDKPDLKLGTSSAPADQTLPTRVFRESRGWSVIVFMLSFTNGWRLFRFHPTNSPKDFRVLTVFIFVPPQLFNSLVILCRIVSCIKNFIKTETPTRNVSPFACKGPLQNDTAFRKFIGLFWTKLSKDSTRK